MNKSIIFLNHNKYTNFNDFLIGLEEGLIGSNNSFCTIIVTGDTDPLASHFFSRDAYSNLVRMEEVAKRYRKKIDIQINTRMPYFIENRSLKDVFHLYPVGINYYITNSNHDDFIKLADILSSIKKLETWDFKNPMKTKIILDIDEQIHRNRLHDIKNAIEKTVVLVESTDDFSFRLTKSSREKIKVLLG